MRVRIIALVMGTLLLLSASLGGAVPGGGVWANTARELQEKQRELDALTQAIEEQKQALVATQQAQRGVLSELNLLEQALALSEKELAFLELQIDMVSTAIAGVEDILEQISERMERREQLLAQRVRAIYRAGMVSYLEVLLSSTSMSDFLTRLDMVRRIIEQDVHLLREAEADQRTHEDQLAELETNRLRLVELQVTQEAKRAQVASRRQQRQDHLRRLTQERVAYERALDELDQETERLSEEIRRLQAALSRAGTGTIAMIRPVEGGWISSAFGMRHHPILGQQRMHTGVDFAVPHGTPIRAAAAGQVILSGSQGGYGLTVIIDHGGGVATLYAHCSTLLVRVGQEMKQGQTLARVGSTGLSTGPHLHFEVRVRGECVDPVPWYQ